MACMPDCDSPVDFTAFTNSQFVANVKDPDYVVGTTYKAELRDKQNALQATFAIAIPSAIAGNTFDMSLTSAILTTAGEGVYYYDVLRIVATVPTRLFGGTFRINKGNTVP